MPRKSSPAVQKAAAVVTAVGDAKAEQDITPRRSARAAAKRELSPGSTEGGRSRRSSTAAQTAASVAESRVTRSRNSLSSRRDSSSPSDNRSGRSSGKEFGLESPASRVKTSRRTTGRINYKESDGEEEVSTPKNEEDDYNADDDFDESDSEGAAKAKNKGKIVSPPKSRVVKGKGKIVKLGGRGRGRPAKKETDGEEEEEEDLKEEQPKTGEASEDNTEQMNISSGRKRTAKVTPISGQEDQDSSGTRRSRRVRQTSGPETGGTEDTKTRRSSRASAQQVESPRTRRASRKQSKQDDEQFEDGLQIDDEESEKYDAATTELDGADPKLESDVSKKRKMEEEEEPSKRLKLDNESENDKDSKSMDNINVCRDGHDSGILKEKTIETNKLDCKDESNISFKDKKSESSESVVEVPEDVEEMEVEGESGITVNVKEQIVEEPMEVDKTNSGSVPIVTVDDSQSSSDKGESNDSVTAVEESKADNQTVDKMESLDKAAVEISRVARSETAYVADSVAPVPFDKKQDNIMSSENMAENTTSVIGNEPSSTVEELCLSSDVTNDSKELINADKCAEEEPDQQPVNEVLDEDKEEIDIASQSSEASESLEKACDNSVDPKDIIEPSSVEEDAATNSTRVSGEQCENLKNISKDAIEQISDNPQAFDSATIGERSVEALDSCSKENIDKDFEEKDKSISDSKDIEFKNHKSPFPEKASFDSTVAESSACSENTFHSEEQNAKASLNGSESDGKINSVLTAQAVTISSDISTENVKEKHSDTFEHVENPAPKANGAHDVIHSNAALSDEQVYVFPNRRYVLNSSLSEDLRLSVKDRMFGFVSYNLGFVIREDSMQKDKLAHELQKLQADIICLQEVTQSLYREVLEPSLDALGYKSVLSIPEGSITGLVTFYKNSVFRLSGLSEASLQKLIEKDLEASSLEPEDKTAVHSYLKKCGNVLFTQFTSLIGEHSLTVANVLMPPSDISTHALQMSCLARELVTMIEGATKPLLLCGAFNMAEGEAPYQLLRDGYLSNDMIEELQRRKDVVLPGKENAALVNLLWKAFQHPSSNLCSCYASVLGRELFIPGEQKTTSPDLLWFSSDCLHTVGVLDIVSGSSEKPEDCHFSLKADVAFSI